MNIAIIGSGIAGLTAAHLLHRQHRITVFEAGETPGGHSNTVDVTLGGQRYAADTGFMVFNPQTYPHFIQMLEDLQVPWRPAEMSFSVQVESSGLEYCGTNLNTVFAQRRNLLRPRFLRMLREILRFNREGLAWVQAQQTAGGVARASAGSLRDWLSARGYSRELMQHYVQPMGAAIWSATPERFADMPAHSFFHFFANHGLLSVNQQPQWRTIVGGSREYVRRLIAPFAENVQLNSPVLRVRRTPQGVELNVADRAPQRFDQVVFACHSDTALAMLADPSPAEREILGAIGYQPNDCVLHTDQRLLPRASRARASWNCHVPSPDAAGQSHAATVTYDLSRLQGLNTPEPLLLTLNRTSAIDPGRVLRRFAYAHPVLDAPAVAAQARHGEINGKRRSFFCGAYWEFGFHEDGVRSALRACAPLLQEVAA